MNAFIHRELVERGPDGRYRPSHRETLHGDRRREALHLSKREGEIASLVADGLSNRDIAHPLGIALSTVETHISSIFSKLGIDSRIALIRLHAGI